MSKMEVKNLSTPDEIRTLPKIKGEVVNIGDYTVMRGTFEPGWKWSDCVKPTVETSSCEVNHVLYVISGKMQNKMNDGSEKVLGPGDAGVIPPGHDAWVVGDKPCISIDFTAGKTYGKK